MKEYEGTILVVSHDRWFVSELANRVLELKPGGYNDYKGTYQQYLDHLGEDNLRTEA